MLKKRLASSAIIFVCIPAVVFAGWNFLPNKQYYITGAAVVVLAMAAFLINVKKSQLHARELVILASLAAIAVTSRAAFYALPHVKPMCAVLIIAGAAFGSETGFLLGALSMLLSNFIFGQGAWTPFQMLGMGLTVFVCAKIFHKTKIGKSPLAVSVIGAVLCCVVYGVVVDASSVLMMSADYSLKSIASIYLAGAPTNLIHGAATGFVLFFLYKPMLEKLERIKVKYSLFE